MSFIFGKKQTLADQARSNVAVYNTNQPKRIQNFITRADEYLKDAIKTKINIATTRFGLTLITFNVANALNDFYEAESHRGSKFLECEIDIPPFAPLTDQVRQTLISNLSLLLTQEEFQFSLVDECYTISWASQSDQDRTYPSWSGSKPGTQNQ